MQSALERYVDLDGYRIRAKAVPESQPFPDDE